MSTLDYINATFPARKTDEEKKAFRDCVIDDLSREGIVARVETTKDGKNNNLIVGDPTKAKAVFVAHYDTPCRSLFPNIMIPKNKLVFYLYQFAPIVLLLAVSLAVAYLFGMVLLNDVRVYGLTFIVIYYGAFFLMMRLFKNMNNYNDNTSGVATVLDIIKGTEKSKLDEVAFILFDNEEKGKKGSSAYFKDHKEMMQNRFVLNFDCVGNGNNFIFIAQKKAVDSPEFKALNDSYPAVDEFNLDFCTYKEGNSNSDHKSFPAGVGCVACLKLKNGLLYTPRIHTHKDTVANNVNIDYLSKNTIRFIEKL